MDEYTGGLTQNYRFHEEQLNLAAKNIKRIEKLSEKLHTADMYDLLKNIENHGYIAARYDKLLICFENFIKLYEVFCKKFPKQKKRHSQNKVRVVFFVSKIFCLSLRKDSACARMSAFKQKT